MRQGVIKRRRLSWLTNSTLVYEPKCWGMRCLSQWVQLYPWSPNKLWRSNSMVNLCHDGSVMFNSAPFYGLSSSLLSGFRNGPHSVIKHNWLLMWFVCPSVYEVIIAEKYTAIYQMMCELWSQYVFQIKNRTSEALRVDVLNVYCTVLSNTSSHIALHFSI